MTAPTKASTVTEVVEVGDGRSGGGQGAKPPKGGGEQRGPSPGARQPEEHAPPTARHAAGNVVPPAGLEPAPGPILSRGSQCPRGSAGGWLNSRTWGDRPNRWASGPRSSGPGVVESVVGG